MSRILSETGRDVVVKRVRTLEAIKCDRCGKELVAIDLPYTPGNPPQHYFEVDHYHIQHGAIADYHDEFDLCEECCSTFVSNYVATSDANDHVEIVCKAIIRHDVYTEGHTHETY